MDTNARCIKAFTFMKMMSQCLWKSPLLTNFSVANPSKKPGRQQSASRFFPERFGIERLADLKSIITRVSV